MSQYHVYDGIYVETEPHYWNAISLFYNCGVRLPLQTDKSYNSTKYKVLPMIVDAIWYVPKTVIRTDL
jgi:hypothetical protein